MTLHQSTADHPSDHSNEIRCLNCGHTFVGAYCPCCGQKAATTRLQMKQMLKDAVSHLFSLDSKIIRTVIGLTANPGKVCREYVAGKRTRYVHPMRYCVGVVAVAIIINVLVGIDPAQITSSVKLTDEQAAVQKAIASVVIKHLDLIILAIIPLLALVVRILFRKSNYNYAEVTAFLLFVLAQVFLIGLPVSFLKAVSIKAALVGKLVILTFLFSYASIEFFQVSKFAGILKSIIVVFFYFVFITIVAILLILPKLAALFGQ